MALRNESWPAGHVKNFNVGHYTQTVQSNIFIPAMLIGTIDFYHFLQFSLTLTLPGGRKVSAKQNLLISFFAHFSSDQNEIRCGNDIIQAEHHEIPMHRLRLCDHHLQIL